MVREARLATSATGALAQFNTAGVVSGGDVHIAQRLATVAGMNVDSSDSGSTVLITIACVVRAVRAGSVCLDVDRMREMPRDFDTPIPNDELPWPDPDDIVAAITADEQARQGITPLRVVHASDGARLIYLDKYLRQEQHVRAMLRERAVATPQVDHVALASYVDRFFPRAEVADHGSAQPESDEQRNAAIMAATHRTTIIAGGPGTGKTYTVARILAVLAALHGPDLRVGLCAPTGRAAAALQTAVTAQGDLPLPALHAVTMHRLLGPLPPGNVGFRHNRAHRLPHDVVVVDEASMVSLTMMYHLLDALRPTTRLILIGDPHQLASVDAGAVLADLVAAATADGANNRSASEADGDGPVGCVVLHRRRRFGSGIGDFADAIRDGDADAAIRIIESGSGQVRLIDPGDIDAIAAETTPWVHAMRHAAQVGDIAEAMAALQSHRVLCAYRDGPAGVSTWIDHLIRWAALPAARSWPAGTPLLITETDRRNRLFTGDSGIVVAEGDMVSAVFGDASHSDYRRIAPNQLHAAQAAYATTIHRSQGSQYHGVTVVVPPPDSALLTRELLYTAITRARDTVTLVGTIDGVRAGIERTVLRASGLRSTITESAR